MRLDKYLKVSRLIKRRTLAKEMAEQGRIKVNNKIAKPSLSVQIGDEIELMFGQTLVTVRVLATKEHVKKEDAASLYELIKEEKINRID